METCSQHINRFSVPSSNHNVSHSLTVLLSIQLLLAEPNPDDGLMSDISVQYKYDRPRFTLTAKEWVQKYAMEDSGSSRKRVAESTDSLDNVKQKIIKQ